MSTITLENGKVLYPRRCTCTGKGITLGYVLMHAYASDQRCADILARHDGFKSFEDAHKSHFDHNPKQSFYYWTEWEITEDDTVLYDFDGNEYSKDKKGNWVIKTHFNIDKLQLIPEPFLDLKEIKKDVNYWERDILKHREEFIRNCAFSGSINFRYSINASGIYFKTREEVNYFFVFVDYYRSERVYKCVFIG